jgi:hypothetical protein
MERSEFSLVGGAVNITVNVAESAIWTDDVFTVISDCKYGDTFSVMAIRTVEDPGFIAVNL